MKNDDKPRVNPFVILREEFDDWAVLFNADTGHGFGLNLTGVYVCKLLDGEHTMDDILEKLREHAQQVPEDAGEHIRLFLDALVAQGLAGFNPNPADGITLRPETCASPPPGARSEAKTFTYEPPRLINLSSGHTIVKNGEKPIANPFVMLREEFDDWAVLFDPDTGHGFGLNPTGVYVCKLLDGEHTMDDLLEKLRGHAVDVPEEAADHIRTFVDALVAEGLAGYGDGSYREKCSHASLGAMNEVKPFTYEPPQLIDFTAGRQARGATCSGHGSHGGSCGSGAGATTCCYSGTCGSDPGNCSCGGGGCGYYNNSNCECNGSCNNVNCTCGYCADQGGAYMCCTGSCAAFSEPGDDCSGGGYGWNSDKCECFSGC